MTYPRASVSFPRICQKEFLRAPAIAILILIPPARKAQRVGPDLALPPVLLQAQVRILANRAIQSSILRAVKAQAKVTLPYPSY